MPDIVIATDSEGVYRSLASVLDTAGTTLRWVRTGQEVCPALDRQPADLVVADGQIGTMGGIAVALDLSLEADAGRIRGAPMLLVLDRRADVFLARRAGVAGWLLKPIDPIRLRKAVAAMLEGGSYYDDTLLPHPVGVPATSTTVVGSGK